MPINKLIGKINRSDPSEKEIKDPHGANWLELWDVGSKPERIIDIFTYFFFFMVEMLPWTHPSAKMS
jgi:hypothetical protein